MDADSDGKLTKKEVLKGLYFRPDVSDMIDKIDEFHALLKPASFEDTLLKQQFQNGHHLTLDEFVNFILYVLDNEKTTFILPPNGTFIPATEEEESEAAVLLQARLRGHKARKDMKKKKEEIERHQAAAKVQARVRGRSIRKKQRRDTQEFQAATKLQAIIRGRQQKKRYKIGGEYHKEWLQLMLQKTTTGGIDIAYFNSIVKYMKLQPKITEEDGKSTIRAVSGNGIKMYFSGYVAFVATYRSLLDKPFQKWTDDDRKEKPKSSNLSPRKTKLSRERIKVLNACKILQYIRRNLKKGWSFEIAQNTFDEKEAEDGYTMSYEQSYHNNVILKTMKRCATFAEIAISKEQKWKRKEKMLKRKRALEAKLKRDQYWKKANAKRIAMYKNNNLYVPRERNVVNIAMKHIVSDNCLPLTYEYSKKRYKKCVDHLKELLVTSASSSNRKNSNNDNNNNNNKYYGEKSLLEMIQLVANTQEAKVEDIPKFICEAFDLVYQFDDDSVEYFKDDLQIIYKSRRAQEALLETLASGYFYNNHDDGDNEQQGENDTLFKKKVLTLYKAQILYKKNICSWGKRDDTNKQMKRMKMKEEEAEIPIFTDKDKTYPPNYGDMKTEAAISRGKKIIINLYEVDNAFVGLKLLSSSSRNNNSTSSTKSVLNKKSQKLLMRYDSSSILGVGGRSDKVDSPWNSPKVKRAKTPLFTDWSPYNGNVDDSLLLNRNNSLLKLPSPSETLKPHTKPWSINPAKKMKLKPSPIALERSSSQKALGIYALSPTSPTYSDSKFKKSLSPRKKKSMERLR